MRNELKRMKKETSLKHVHSVVKVRISMIMIALLNHESMAPLQRPLSHLVLGIMANQSNVDWSFNSKQE